MIGKRFGRFELVAKLGEGGMGEVYEALDAELERRVAIKVLPERVVADPTRLERFRREARAIAALNHPNIVTLHAVEEVDGRRFLVMEKVDGETLGQKIPGGGFSLDALLELAIPMADALAATHDRGIVHRDLKPGNVMVNREGRVKLLDFGLAKLTESTLQPDTASSEEAETRSALLTREGTVVGTAAYMSPEQLRGAEIDSRSDVFSLGTLLFEMATGRRPFQGATAVELASSILKDRPAPLTELRQELPRQLERIIESCLQKDPGQRFQTARDVRNQLAALQAETQEKETLRKGTTSPVAAASPVTRVEAARWLVAALALIAVGAGVYYLTSSTGESGAGESDGPEEVPLATLLDDGRLLLAVLPFENLGLAEDELFADGTSEEIRSRLAMLDGLSVISRTTARQFKQNRPPLGEIARELQVDYLVEGTVRWQPGDDGQRQVRVSAQLIRVAEDTQVWADAFTAVPSDIFAVQAEIAQLVAEELDLEILEPQRARLALERTDDPEVYRIYLRAEELFERGKELESADAVREAIELYEEAASLDPDFAVVPARLAEAHGYLCFYGLDCSDARREAGLAVAARALALDPESPDAHFANGMVAAVTGNFPGAVEEFRLVAERWPNHAQAFWVMSLFETYSGNWESALELAQRATELNPRAARHHCQVGGMNIALGNYDEAILHHQRAIRVTPERACPYYCLLEATVSSGDLERAERFLATLPEGISLEESPSIGYHWVRLDIVQRRYEQALERLAESDEEAYVAGWLHVPKALLAAQIRELEGRPDAAREEYQKAHDYLVPLVEASPFDLRLRGSLAVAYAGLGLRDDAIRQEEIALPALEPGGLSKPFTYRELAHARVLLGDHDEAVDLLRRHLEFSAYMGREYLKLYPTWDPLRDRADFQVMVASLPVAPPPA